MYTVFTQKLNAKISTELDVAFIRDVGGLLRGHTGIGLNKLLKVSISRSTLKNDKSSKC